MGKTTTIAKIASKLKLEKNKKVILATADTYRIAAVEQLKTYANILSVPLKVIYTPEELGEMKEEMEDYDICLKEIDRFLPYIDNWATCDMLAVKVVKKHLDTFIDEIYRWMESDHTYTIRFGVNMLMRYYLEDAFRMEYPEKVAQIHSEEYYVNMMRAWYFATALAKQYDKILPFIEKQKLDVWTHNKTIQKAIESYRITPEQKEYLRGLKIKK